MAFKNLHFSKKLGIKEVSEWDSCVDSSVVLFLLSASIELLVHGRWRRLALLCADSVLPGGLNLSMFVFFFIRNGSGDSKT